MPSLRAFSASAERYSGSRLGSARACSIVARQQAMHGFHHVGDAERLLEVVLDPVVLLQVLGDAPAAVDGAHHDDRDAPVLRAPLDPSRDVEAVQLGEHGVQDDEVGDVVLHEAQGEQPAIGFDDPVALGGEQALEERADLLLVVDDENELAAARGHRVGGLGRPRAQLVGQVGDAGDVLADRAELAGRDLGGLRRGLASASSTTTDSRGRRRRRRAGAWGRGGAPRGGAVGAGLRGAPAEGAGRGRTARRLRGARALAADPRPERGRAGGASRPARAARGSAARRGPSRRTLRRSSS